MLVEARAEHWDNVVILGEEYQQAVEGLRVEKPLGDEDKAARRELLAQILEDDAAIRQLAAPELGRLAALLGNMRRQQTVLQAYCQTIPGA